MDLALCVAEGLLPHFAGRERVPLLDEPITVVLLSLNRSLMQSSRLAPIVGEVLELQCRCHALSASHRMTETGSFTGECTV